MYISEFHKLFSNTGRVIPVGYVLSALGPDLHNSVELHVGEDSPNGPPHHLLPQFNHHLPSLRSLDLAS